MASTLGRNVPGSRGKDSNERSPLKRKIPPDLRSTDIQDERAKGFAIALKFPDHNILETRYPPSMADTGRSPPLHGGHSRIPSRVLPSFQQTFAHERDANPHNKVSLPPLDTHLPPSSSRDHYAQGRDIPTNPAKRRRISEDFGDLLEPTDFRSGVAGRDVMAVDMVSPRFLVDRSTATRHDRSEDGRCCRPSCQGANCSAVRTLLIDLIDQIIEIDMSEPHMSAEELRNVASPIPHLHQIPVSQALDWTVQRLKANSVALKSVFASRLKSEPAGRNVVPDHSMLQRPDQLAHNNNHRRGSYIQDLAHDQRSLQSPISQSPGPPRLLPTPTSMNMPMPGASSAGSPAITNYWSASSSHVQDLQHQVSLKTLALQTLQREYDSLLQKLERQRLKSQTLERKFEATDTEINSLTDDKERLEKQVELLEKQLEVANAARDEARQASTGQATQYMRILEMGTKLNEKAAADRSAWEEERTTLKRRVEFLEAREESAKLFNTPLAGPAEAGKELSSVTSESTSLEKKDTDVTADPSVHLDVNAPLSGESVAEKSTVGESSISRTHASKYEEEIEVLQARVRVLDAALRAVIEGTQSSRDAMLRLMACQEKIDDIVRTAIAEPL